MNPLAMAKKITINKDGDSSLKIEASDRSKISASNPAKSGIVVDQNSHVNVNQLEGVLTRNIRDSISVLNSDDALGMALDKNYAALTPVEDVITDVLTSNKVDISIKVKIQNLNNFLGQDITQEFHTEKRYMFGALKNIKGIEIDISDPNSLLSNDHDLIFISERLGQQITITLSDLGFNS